MRALRLLQLLRLIRAATVLRRLLTATAAHVAAILAGMVVIGGGTAFADVESEQRMSAWDGIWWRSGRARRAVRRDRPRRARIGSPWPAWQSASSP